MFMYGAVCTFSVTFALVQPESTYDRVVEPATSPLIVKGTDVSWPWATGTPVEPTHPDGVTMHALLLSPIVTVTTTPPVGAASESATWRVIDQVAGTDAVLPGEPPTLSGFTVTAVLVVA